MWTLITFTPPCPPSSYTPSPPTRDKLTGDLVGLRAMLAKMENDSDAIVKNHKEKCAALLKVSVPPTPLLFILPFSFPPPLLHFLPSSSPHQLIRTHVSLRSSLSFPSFLFPLLPLLSLRLRNVMPFVQRRRHFRSSAPRSSPS